MQARGRAILEGLIAGLAAVALAGGCTRSAKPTAAEVLAKNVDARGGLEAWRKVQTMVWTGRVESAHAPAKGIPFTLEQKRPNKTRMEVNALGEKSVRVFDGARGWRQKMAHGQPEVQPFSPQELQFAQTAHGIDGPLIDSAAKGTSVVLEGVEDVATETGPRKAYHLSLRSAKGTNEEVWVDASTWLEVRYDRMVDGPGGAQRRVTTTYADYHNVDGLQIPFVVETGVGTGMAPDKLLLDKVALNEQLDDSTFAKTGGSRIQQAPGRLSPGFAPAAPVSAGLPPSAPR